MNEELEMAAARMQGATGFIFYPQPARHRPSYSSNNPVLRHFIVSLYEIQALILRPVNVECNQTRHRPVVPILIILNLTNL